MGGKRSTLHGVDKLVAVAGCRRRLCWREDESAVLQYPQFSTHFPKGLALEISAQSTFHWQDLSAWSNTDHSQIPPS